MGMTGRELLEAMGYVDEKYVDEAENESLRHVSHRGYLRLATMAACLCILVMGIAFLMHLPGLNGMKAASADCAATENNAFAPETVTDQKPESEEDTPLTLILRVEAVTEAGFDATVVQTGDEDAFPVGMTLRVEMNMGTRENADGMDWDYKFSLPEGTLVQVQPGVLDGEAGTITVDEVKILEDGAPEK